ncbi:MAG TPA: hypothetical protein V6D29_00695 [Leptolyngbyaceae cyanobacterium]
MQSNTRFAIVAMGVGMVFMGLLPPSGALPPPEDVPEEILRTEIITEARSPIDGQPLSAAEYAKLQEELQNPNDSGIAPANFREAVFLLQIRRILKPILPIIP